MTTATVNPSWGPNVTVTVDDDTGDLSGIVELDELDPTRDTTAEERAAGITSLDPPAASVRARASRYDTHRALIDALLVATSASADATDGVGGMGAILMLQLRTAFAIRKALREVGEEI